MMPSAVRVIVLARRGGLQLVRTLDALDRQSSRPSEISVIARAPTPRELQAIQSLAEPRGVRVHEAARRSLGETLNAVIAPPGSDAFLWLEEGDEPSHDWLRAAHAVAEGCALAAATIEWIAGAGAVEAFTPSALDPESALAAPHLAPVTGVFSRAAWNAIGGFDPTLPALVEYDFILRLFGTVGRGAVVPGGVVRRPLRGAAEDESQARKTALRAVLGKHLAVLQNNPAAFLVDRERHATTLRDRHRELVARRDATVRAIEDARSDALPLRAFLRGHGRGHIDFGELRETTPVSADWGYERGLPLDRVYIERFIADHAGDVRGAVLEVQENDLTRRFGGVAVTRSDVVDIDPANARAGIVADLRNARAIAPATYDCIILTQTLHVIDDMPAVLRTCHRILKPGGVLLATVPSASRVCVEYGRDGDFWRVTEAGARRIFEPVFGESFVKTRSFGSVLTTTAFLQGVAAHELLPAEYDATDPAHPTLVGVRAVKESAAHNPVRTPERGRAAILLYHRVGTFDPDPHGLAISAALFDQQMALVASRYLPVALGDALDAAAQRRLPHRAVAITFDDGYRDNLTCAAPILACHGIPAAFFLTTAHFSERREFWWDTLARVFANDPTAHAHWYDRLVRGDADEIRNTLDRLREEAGTPARDCDTVTPEEALKLAASASHTIGGHGVDHLYLPAQSDERRAREFVQSRRTLEDLLGRDVRWFAYPFGAYDEQTCEAARRAGFDGALTCDSRPVQEEEDVFRLPRIEVRCRTIEEFAGLLEGVFSGF